jgi:hypothetical protein
MTTFSTATTPSQTPTVIYEVGGVVPKLGHDALPKNMSGLSDGSKPESERNSAGAIVSSTAAGCAALCSGQGQSNNYDFTLASCLFLRSHQTLIDGMSAFGQYRTLAQAPLPVARLLPLGPRLPEDVDDAPSISEASDV